MMTDAPPPAPYPADTSVQHFHKLPLDVVRLQKSSLWMESEDDPWLGFGAINIWIDAWMGVPTGSIDPTDRLIHKRAKMPKTEWERVGARILEGFVLHDDGRWYHPVLVEMALTSIAASRKQSDRAKKRWQKNDQETPADDSGNAGGNATASEKHARASDQDATASKNHAVAMPGTERNGTVQNSRKDNPPAPVSFTSRDIADATAPEPIAGRTPEPWELILKAAEDGIERGGAARCGLFSFDDKQQAKAWAEVGVSPDLVLLVAQSTTERKLAKGERPPGSMKFLRGAIADARDRPPPELPPPKAEDRERENRRIRLEHFVKGGQWLTDLWGPPPTVEQAHAELSGAKVAA